MSVDSSRGSAFSVGHPVGLPVDWGIYYFCGAGRNRMGFLEEVFWNQRDRNISQVLRTKRRGCGPVVDVEREGRK
jgi:hypothetical protein